MKKEYKMKCRNCGEFYSSKTTKRNICRWCTQERGELSRSNRIRILEDCIKDYKIERKVSPSRDLVKKWAENKFNISKKTAGVYLGGLKKTCIIKK